MPPGGPPGPGGQTGIQVKTKFFFLAFLLYFFKPSLHLDGGPPVPRPWGDTFIPTGPGRHVVRCYVPYLFLPTMGDSSIEVDVPPGAVVPVTWRAPLVVFSSGKWKFAAPAAAPPALSSSPPGGPAPAYPPPAQPSQAYPPAPPPVQQPPPSNPPPPQQPPPVSRSRRRRGRRRDIRRSSRRPSSLPAPGLPTS